VNCLVAGSPAGTALELAAALLAADPEAPVTLLSDDTEGLLAVLDRPGLARCEVLWADAASPATVDDALVHRRMLHGRPDVVVVVVDELSADAAAGGSAWAMASVLAPRLSGTPLVVTGTGAAAVESALAALLDDLTEATGQAPACAVVPGCDPDAVVGRATELVCRSPAPEAVESGPLVHGHCAH
jgi:hypothetical protein